MFLYSTFQNDKKNNGIKKNNSDKNLNIFYFNSNRNDTIFNIKNNKKKNNFLFKTYFINSKYEKIKNFYYNKPIYSLKKNIDHIHTHSSFLHHVSILDSYKDYINFTPYIKNIIHITKNIPKYVINYKYEKNIQKNIYQNNNSFMKTSLSKDEGKKNILNFNINLLEDDNFQYHSEWKKAIDQQLLFFIGNKENIAEIKIQPKYFSPLYIQIHIKNNIATVDFISNCSDINNFLKSIIPFLKSSLIQRGIKVDKINVNIPIVLKNIDSNIKYNKEKKKDIILDEKNIEKLFNLYQKNINNVKNKEIDIYI